MNGDMKHLTLTICTLGLIATASTSAFARDGENKPLPRSRAQMAELIAFDLDSSFPEAEMVQSGALKIDRDLGKITVLVQRKFECPGKKLCAQTMPAVVSYEFRMTDLRYDTCGARVYVGIDDRTSIGGERKQITVTDRTSETCASIGIIADTEAVIETEWVAPSGQLIQGRSILEGTRLQ